MNLVNSAVSPYFFWPSFEFVSLGGSMIQDLGILELTIGKACLPSQNLSELDR